jgi:NUMOD4 motif
LNAPSILELEAVACCDGETWKPIPDWPHEASTCGRVRSIDRLGDDGIWLLGAILPPQPDKRPGKGYLYYDLRDGKRRRRIPAAVAVLEAHDRPRPGPGYEACHNHGIRTDNHWPGVRWDTREANIADMIRHRLEREQAVTTLVTTGPETALSRHGSQVSQGGAPSGPVVTATRHSDGPHGTGSLPIPLNFPSHSMFVNPFLRTFRTSFQSLRNRKAA